MALLVQKYGGTSVGSTERIQAVADRIIYTIQQGHQVVVVLSAMSGETNRLAGLASEITSTPAPRELDVLLSSGEQVSIALLSIALISRGFSAVSMLADQVGLKTTSRFGKARIESVNTDVVEEHLQHGRVIIVAGFQGRDIENNITTLGRGGTDTSAVAIAAALKADECQIFTDVDGIYTTDPRVVPNAKRLSHIYFDEMFELASLGAKVLQKRSVELAGKYQVKVRVLSSFIDIDTNLFEQGTLINYENRQGKESELEQLVVTGIACSSDEAMIVFDSISVKDNEVAELLSIITDQGIEVDMLSQSPMVAEQKTQIGFTVAKADFGLAMSLLRQYVEKNKNISFQSMQGLDSVAKISVVGVGIRSHAGTISKVLSVLSELKVPVLLASTTEIKVSVIIDKRYMELGAQALHDKFGLHT